VLCHRAFPLLKDTVPSSLFFQRSAIPLFPKLPLFQGFLNAPLSPLPPVQRISGSPVLSFPASASALFSPLYLYGIPIPFPPSILASSIPTFFSFFLTIVEISSFFFFFSFNFCCRFPFPPNTAGPKQEIFCCKKIPPPDFWESLRFGPSDVARQSSSVWADLLVY